MLDHSHAVHQVLHFLSCLPAASPVSSDLVGLGLPGLWLMVLGYHLFSLPHLLKPQFFHNSFSYRNVCVFHRYLSTVGSYIGLQI